MKNCTVVLFGGTGDLSKKKLIPALIALATKHPDTTTLALGVAIERYDDAQYKEFLAPGISLPQNLSLHYYQADFSKSDSLKGIKDRLATIESVAPDCRLCYLATSYQLFSTIASHIGSWSSKTSRIPTRIIAEKPFGKDRISSDELNKALRKHFEEKQIYRVDHYLAKETVDTLLKLRLSNPLFENIWNSRFVAKIRIVVNEDIGVGNRLGYYDGAGAVKDMVQNHMLETLSLVLMDPPHSLDDDAFKAAKVDAISKLEFRNELSTGQYLGYQDEVKDINPGSKTETFVDLKLYSKARRWKGTQITLRTGKMLSKREAHITLEFKKEPCMIYCNINSPPNKLKLRIQPIQDIELTMNTTLPGEEMSLAPVKMAFFPATEFHGNSPEAYQTILKDVIQGNKRIFLCDKEIEAAWRLTDKIAKNLKKVAPVGYAPGTDGPGEKR